ncbi:MAG: pilus assembly protein [Myxococcales bacterium]
MAPILSAIVLWLIYFWEVQKVRIKAAEAARYLAFERTVRPNLQAISQEAQERFQNLDSSDRGVELPAGYLNRVTIAKATVREVPAPMSSASLSQAGSGQGLGDLLSKATSLLGNSVGGIIGTLGFRFERGGSQGEVEFHVENRIIPQRIAYYLPQTSALTLDLTFRDTYFTYFDTWRAWNYGDSPANYNTAYSTVQRNTANRVRRIAYWGLSDASGVSGVVNAVESVLDLLGLDFPLGSDYITDSVVMLPATQASPRTWGLAGGARTVPGDVMLGAYWKNDSQACLNTCEPDVIKRKRGFLTNGGYEDNWPMRAYNCRGQFFQGAKKSDKPEFYYSQSRSEGKTYFNYGSKACAESQLDFQ